jgi:hypothetical protein
VGIFSRFFFSGKLPDPLRAELEAEGIVLLEEDLRGTITYRNYRAPGRRYGLRKARIAGAIAVTRQRVVAWGMNALGSRRSAAAHAERCQNRRAVCRQRAAPLTGSRTA